MQTGSSRISGFYKLPPEERLEKVVENRGLTEEDLVALRDHERTGVGLADRMIENAIGTMQIPLGVATNFVVNGKDRLIPMAIEEPSVVAAASNAARLARETGGFFTSNSGTIMRAQIQATGVSDPAGARARLFEAREDLLELANEQDPMLVRLGGGASDIEVHVLRSSLGPMVVLHLIVDVSDAMGANAVNTMAEALAPTVEAITGGRVYLRILSNLADLRLARARAIISRDSLGGEEEVRRLSARPRARRDRPLPRRDAQQGRHERRIGRGARHRQRHQGGRSRCPLLRGALGKLRGPYALGEERRRGPRGEHRDADARGARGRGDQGPTRRRAWP